MKNSSRLKTTAPLALLLLGLSCSAPPDQGTTTPKGSASSSVPSEPGSAPETPAGSEGKDVLKTSLGELTITPITHGSLLLEVAGKAIYVDPWSQGDFQNRPKADLILITDIHQDHMDPKAISLIQGEKTQIVAPEAVAATVKEAKVLKNGENIDIEGIGIEAVPMYNLVRGPSEGTLYHDKGRGNGYILTVGDTRIYLSGDTECTPEMRALKDIDVAFVCMNLPYTMTPGEAADCVKSFRPKIVYPYHYRDSNLEEFKAPLAGEEGIEVRLREWY